MQHVFSWQRLCRLHSLKPPASSGGFKRSDLWLIGVARCATSSRVAW
jgi:hypothetical protein